MTIKKTQIHELIMDIIHSLMWIKDLLEEEE